VDQGYFFEIIEELPFLKNPEQLEKITKNKKELCLSDKQEQKTFLDKILLKK